MNGIEKGQGNLEEQGLTDTARERPRTKGARAATAVGVSIMGESEEIGLERAREQ